MKPPRHLLVFSFYFLVFLAACGGKETAPFDPSLRARVDGLNREAFLERYRDIPRSLDCAREALTLVADSLPAYYDGRLRACNNLAYAYYMLDMTDSAHAYLDSVEYIILNSQFSILNSEVEHTIAQLTRIRLLQRECRLAESYGLLHDVGDINALRRQRHRNSSNAYLYDFARMEYYITSLTLNYHYRNDAVASSSGTELTPDTRDQMQLILDRVEQDRPSFRCDYSENIALNYAIAHSYYRLAAVSADRLPNLRKAFDYIRESQRIVDMPGHYCDYHQANLYQLRAFIGADTSWGDDLLRLHDSLPLLPVSVDTVLDLFRLSTDMFFDTPDPYQHLGAVVAAAEYCLRVGDTAQAEDYYAMALADTSWRDGMAPKFEAMLYDGLLRIALSPYLNSSPKLGEVAQPRSATLWSQRAGGVCPTPEDNPTPEHTGHGFGLILCRYIVKLHDDNTLRGCRIWAESPNPAAAGAPHPGTVMHLCLPQAEKTSRPVL